MSDVPDNIEQDSPGSGSADEAPEATDSEFAALVPQRKPDNRAALLVFGVMIIGCLVLYFTFMRGPRTVRAASDSSVKAGTAIHEFLTDGKQNVAVMRRMLANANKVVQQFLSYPNAVQVPADRLHGNPFEAAAPRPVVSDDTEALRKKREADHAAALRAVEALALQSIIHGQHPACIINNKLYEEGEQVDDFTIEKVNADSVIVRTEAYRFELRIQR